MGICCLATWVIWYRGLRVFSADPPFRCIRCSSCGFGCLPGRNIHAEETGGSGSVIIWLTSRTLAPAAMGLLSDYPVVVPRSGDSVARRRCPVQRSGRRSGSPRLAAFFSKRGPSPDRASPLINQSCVVSVVWVMNGGLPVFVDQSWSRSPSTKLTNLARCDPGQ
jgi:hypothetical protein